MILIYNIRSFHIFTFSNFLRLNCRDCTIAEIQGLGPEIPQRIYEKPYGSLFQIMVRIHCRHPKLPPESEKPLPPSSFPPQLQSSGPYVLNEVPDIQET